MWPTALSDAPWMGWPPVRTAEEAARFVDWAGACLFQRGRGSPELPALSDVMASDTEVHPFIWKDDLHAAKRVCYGKVIRGQPGFISLSLLPYFYVVQGRTPDDHRRAYNMGTVSKETVRILDALRSGPMTSRQLKAAVGAAGRGAASRFDAALAELQRTFAVTILAARSRTRAHYEYIWDLFERKWPEVIESARAVNGRAEAIAAIGAGCREALGDVSSARLRHLFGW